MDRSPQPKPEISPPDPPRINVALAALWRRTSPGSEPQILVAKRMLDASIVPGHWEIPGGKIEFGESARTAVARELLEELDVDCTAAHCEWRLVKVIEPPAPKDRPAPIFHLFTIELPPDAIPRALASQSIAWIPVRWECCSEDRLEGSEHRTIL